ncbi:MAG TPA: hypothetical protein VGD91_21425 [Trebonia sp.]
MKLASWRRGSRAFRPGSRTAIVLLTAVVLAVVATVAAYRASARPASAAAPAATYGGLPAWLPTPTVSVGRIVQASAAHPQLAIEGDTVSVDLVHGSASATAVGPDVPEEGQFPVPATTPCSFTVTFTRVSGTVPLKAAAFTILDELGQLHHPQVTVSGGAPPQQVGPGQTVTLIVKDVLPTGSGTLQWAPETAKPLVSWDFDVEID